MVTIRRILKDCGYSDKAIAYYINRVNVGVIDKPTIQHAITGPCGDTIEYYFIIESNVIREVKFLAIGCPGIYSSGSALTTMILGKTPEQAIRLHVEDIVDFLEGVPEMKMECVVLAKKGMDEALVNL